MLAVQEITEQSNELGVKFDDIVMVGSSRPRAVCRRLQAVTHP